MDVFPLSINPIGAIVLALAACGLPAPNIGPNVTQSTALHCGLSITEQGGQLQILGQLQAVDAVTGRYALTIAQVGQGQSFIDQSGDFTALAGETIALGSASISGSAAQYNSILTVDYEDTTITCPVTVTGR